MQVTYNFDWLSRILNKFESFEFRKQFFRCRLLDFFYFILFHAFLLHGFHCSESSFVLIVITHEIIIHSECELEHVVFDVESFRGLWTLVRVDVVGFIKRLDLEIEPEVMRLAIDEFFNKIIVLNAGFDSLSVRHLHFAKFHFQTILSVKAVFENLNITRLIEGTGINIYFEVQFSEPADKDLTSFFVLCDNLLKDKFYIGMSRLFVTKLGSSLMNILNAFFPQGVRQLLLNSKVPLEEREGLSGARIQ